MKNMDLLQQTLCAPLQKRTQKLKGILNRSTQPATGGSQEYSDNASSLRNRRLRRVVLSFRLGVGSDLLALCYSRVCLVVVGFGGRLLRNNLRPRLNGRYVGSLREHSFIPSLLHSRDDFLNGLALLHNGRHLLGRALLARFSREADLALGGLSFLYRLLSSAGVLRFRASQAS